MLKCPACGRTGGPFRLRHQIQADGQVIRSWSCPCGDSFHASAGAERPSSTQTVYSGFVVEWQGQNYTIDLKHMAKHETAWALGDWQITVAGPPDGPGTRTVTLASGPDKEPVGEWRLQPGWGPGEVARRIKVWPLPAELPPDLLSRILVRLMA